MKPSIIPTVAAFASVATVSFLSLLYSCATGPGHPATQAYQPVSLHVGEASPGVWPTVERLTSVTAVWRLSADRKGPRTPVPADAWSYDFEKAHLLSNLPETNEDTVLEVQGIPTSPRSFSLESFQGPPEDLFIIVGNHRAIPGYEYNWNPQKKVLEFRTDLDIESQKFFVSFPTSEGSSSYGNHPLDGTFALLQAQWTQEKIAREHRELGGDYTLDFSNPGTPRVVFQPDQTDPVPSPRVSHPRFGPQEQALSREMGWDLRRPPLLLGHHTYQASGSFLEEQVLDGTLNRWVSQWYLPKERDEALVVEVASRPFFQDSPDPKWVISQKTVPVAGASVECMVSWALVQTSPPTTKAPQVGQVTEFRWQEGNLWYRLALPSSESIETGLTWVQTLIEARRPSPVRKDR